MLQTREPSIPSSQSDSIEAVVQSVHRDHSYVMTLPMGEIPGVGKPFITFSFKVWSGANPEQLRKGQVVVLKNVTRFERGWRAMVAEPVQLGSKGVANE